MLGVDFVLDKGQCDMGMKCVICPLSKPYHSKMFCTASPSGTTYLLGPSLCLMNHTQFQRVLGEVYE